MKEDKAKKYWELETPIVVRTTKNVLSWYPRAKKLSVGRPEWTDAEGVTNRGKTVTLDVRALAETPEARQVLEEILAVIDR